MPAAGEYRASAEAQDDRWDADQYRERARLLRKLALRARSAEVRSDLMALALQHERMAAYIETRSYPVDGARAKVAD